MEKNVFNILTITGLLACIDNTLEKKVEDIGTNIKSKREVIYDSAIANIALIMPHLELKEYSDYRKNRYIAIDASDNTNLFYAGYEDAVIYKQFVDSCEAAEYELWSELLEITKESEVQQPITSYLSCSDGWISSCGCGGGRGCCSWHGGFGECITEYKTLYKGEFGLFNFFPGNKKSEHYRDRLSVCDNFVPPWPFRGVEIQDDRSVKVINQYNSLNDIWLSAKHQNVTLIEENPANRGTWAEAGEGKLPADRRRVKLPKNAKLGVNTEYLNGWKSYHYNGQ